MKSSLLPPACRTATCCRCGAMMRALPLPPHAFACGFALTRQRRLLAGRALHSQRRDDVVHGDAASVRHDSRGACALASATTIKPKRCAAHAADVTLFPTPYQLLRRATADQDAPPVGTAARGVTVGVGGIAGACTCARTLTLRRACAAGNAVALPLFIPRLYSRACGAASPASRPCALRRGCGVGAGRSPGAPASWASLTGA